MPKSKTEEDKNEKSSFKEYFDSLTSNKHRLTKNAKIIKTFYKFNYFEYGKPARFMLLGERDSTEFILKTELSEVPISGDLTFKSFIMEYRKTKKSYYRPIAMDIAKSFGQ